MVSLLMVNLIVLLIIISCVAYLYLKSTLARSFATTIVAICASIIAFGYFEILSSLLINQVQSAFLVPWASSICFLILFVAAFAGLQTVVINLIPDSINFGTIAEKSGRIICGFFLGLTLAGFLLSMLLIAPLPDKYPYPRFEADVKISDIAKPQKVLFNADGFTTGLFNMVSNGSFSGKKSFAALHPDFLDQVFLNRLASDEVSVVTDSKAIQIPAKIAVWPAPQDMKDAVDPNQLVKSKNGFNSMIVRIGIEKKAISNKAKNAGIFTPSQLRLICKRVKDVKHPLLGYAINVYPTGYLKTADQLQLKRLNEKISIKRSDFNDNDKVLWIDFVFDVPAGFVPKLLEFKQNIVALVPPPVNTEQAPEAATFTESIELKTEPKKNASKRRTSR
ncbi:MAG: CvpA family protein [Planctomycetes bacterium]|nr:CvpA family protein [Planctomycetota bacterium]